MREETIKKILASTPELYDQIATDFYQTRKKPWPATDLIKSYVNQAGSIIDVGCGSGRLSELVSDNQKYLGLDNSSELIKIAKNNYSNRKNINFQVADAIHDKLPQAKFDLALIIAVMHHLPTRQLRLEVLKKINRCLANNGLIIVTSWNLWQKNYRRHLFNYKLKMGKYKILSLNDALIPWQRNSHRYVHSFSKSELKNLLQKAGFKVNKVFYEYQGEKASRLKAKNIIAIATKK